VLVTADSNTTTADSALIDASGLFSGCPEVVAPTPPPPTIISVGGVTGIVSSQPSILLSGTGPTVVSSGRLTVVGGGSGTSSASVGAPCSACPDPVEPVDPEEVVAYAKRVDFITDLLLYRGEADPGTTDGQALWRVRRITIGTDNDVTEEWANGSAEYVHVWDSRLAYPYS
jgi:hypothetical protein